MEEITSLRAGHARVFVEICAASYPHRAWAEFQIVLALNFIFSRCFFHVFQWSGAVI
jgi:hypothetical protein